MRPARRIDLRQDPRAASAAESGPSRKLAFRLGTVHPSRPHAAAEPARGDLVFGPQSFVLDTTTHLEWLRVPLTGFHPLNVVTCGPATCMLAQGTAFTNAGLVLPTRCAMDRSDE
jgi:hypothetical protein